MIVPILSQPEGQELPRKGRRLSDSGEVPILSQPEGQELPRSIAVVLQILFQSSPSPKARSYLPGSCPGRRSPSVPILSQPEGQELPDAIATLVADFWFQSSPSPKARSYPSKAYEAMLPHWFQSSPSPKARSYLWPAKILQLRRVPILSQPEGQELLHHHLQRLSYWRVPILSQPEGQELLRLASTLLGSSSSSSNPLPARRPGATPGSAGGLLRGRFQSSPSPKARSYSNAMLQEFAVFRFQSSPSPKARSYQRPGTEAADGLPVPILSQPEGQELRF